MRAYLTDLCGMPAQAWIAEAVGLAALLYTFIGG